MGDYILVELWNFGIASHRVEDKPSYTRYVNYEIIHTFTDPSSAVVESRPSNPERGHHRTEFTS